jgi:hypothetical protein
MAQTAIMSLNEFNRELGKSVEDERLRYILGLVWEGMVALAQQNEENAVVMLGLANSLQGLVQLHEHTQEGLNKVLRRGQTDGVEVSSVLNTPETEN